jgi:hypothetical protein
MTELESQALKKWIDEELAAGKIRRSESEARAPVMFVKKADGSLRLVVDYQRLNEVTKKNVYPLPRQDDLMAQLQGAKIFTKLDLQWGYNNVHIKEGANIKLLSEPNTDYSKPLSCRLASPMHLPPSSTL